MSRCAHSARALGLLLVLVAVAATTGCPSDPKTFSESRTDSAALNMGGLLNVTNVNGTVTITGWENEEVTLEAEVRVVDKRQSIEDTQAFLDDIGTEITGAGDEVSIETVIPKGHVIPGVMITVDYTIQAPSQANITLVSDNGTVKVLGIDGAVKVDIAIGTIVCDGVTGNLDLALTRGNIEVNHPALPVASESITGRVGTGNIVLSVPAESSFTMLGSVEIGSVDVSDFPTLVSTTNRVGTNVDGDVGGGGASFDFEVEIGNIEIGIVDVNAIAGEVP